MLYKRRAGHNRLKIYLRIEENKKTAKLPTPKPYTSPNAIETRIQKAFTNNLKKPEKNL